MNIDLDQIKKDAEEGTRGPWFRDCWDVLGAARRHDGDGTGHVCEVSTPNGVDDKYWEPGEDEANIRRIARVPDLEVYAIETQAKLEAANQMRLALAGYISPDEAIRAWDATQKEGEVI